MACRKKSPAKQMLRFVCGGDGKIVFDQRRRAPGRGANVCPARKCLELAVERKAFARAFKRAVLVNKSFLESVVF